MDKVTVPRIRPFLGKHDDTLKLAAKRISGYVEMKLQVIQCKKQKKQQGKIN